MRKVFLRLLLKLLNLYQKIKINYPYNLAKIHIAFCQYEASEKYQERLKILGPDSARKAFVEAGDYRYFLERLSFRDKLRAFFIPFCYITKYPIILRKS
jgi:hypothetical protein